MANNTNEQLLGLFSVAGIKIDKHWELTNQYWPDNDAYVDIRRKNPWLLLKTTWGLVEIGWRKRVISIDWKDTSVRGILTEDDVTKSDTYVHAWNYENALGYLIAWRKLAEKVTNSRADQIISAIIKDLTDRRGLRQEWNNIDEETRNEIIVTWTKVLSS